MLLVFLLVLRLSAPLASQESIIGCSEGDLRSLAFGSMMLARGDDNMYRQAVEKGVRGPDDRCILIKLSRSALLGWVEARRLATSGGAVESQGSARTSLEELERLKGGPIDLEVEYAQIALRAAMAAAQDERSELELLLTHARDLAERLLGRGRKAMWPRPFNLLAGELWLEVDRYEEARAAFERAVKSDGGAVALVGLARALARLGLHDEACQTYRQAREATASLRSTARSDLGACH